MPYHCILTVQLIFAFQAKEMSITNPFSIQYTYHTFILNTDWILFGQSPGKRFLFYESFISLLYIFSSFLLFLPCTPPAHHQILLFFCSFLDKLTLLIVSYTCKGMVSFQQTCILEKATLTSCERECELLKMIMGNINSYSYHKSGINQFHLLLISILKA